MITFYQTSAQVQIKGKIPIITYNFSSNFNELRSGIGPDNLLFPSKLSKEHEIVISKILMSLKFF